jgi:predicted permease
MSLHEDAQAGSALRPANIRHGAGFAAAAVVSLALGVGANTAIFSVASALLLRPLPYPDAERLVILWNRSPGLGIAEDWFSTAQYFDIKTAAQHFDQVAIAIGSNYNVTGDGPPERLGTIRVSSNLLPMLGANAARGRLFAPEEDLEGTAPTAILHHGTWMRRYGGDPHVIGRTVVLNGVSYKIVGVMPASFSLRREVMPTLGVAADAEILLSLPLGPKAPQIRGREDYNILARLKPGVSVPQAQAEMDALTARLRQEHPDVYPPNGGLTFGVVPLKDQVVGDVRSALLVLIGAVGFVLLIACANVANLLLSRALGRQREIAVRAALGASRPRIVRQLLTESMLLGVTGGALGLVFAYWSLEGIRVLGPASVPRLHEIAIDGGGLLFTLLLSVLSGVLFGLAPALRLGGLNLHDTLKDASRGVSGGGAVWGRRQNVRRLLVMSELALSVMVLIGAGLLIRSYARLQNVPPGFDPAGVLTLELTDRRRTDAQAVVSRTQLWPRRGAAGRHGRRRHLGAPLGQMMAWGPITVEGRILRLAKSSSADQRFVGGDYFARWASRSSTDDCSTGDTRTNRGWSSSTSSWRSSSGRARMGSQTRPARRISYAWITLSGVVGEPADASTRFRIAMSQFRDDD